MKREIRKLRELLLDIFEMTDVKSYQSSEEIKAAVEKIHEKIREELDLL